MASSKFKYYGFFNVPTARHHAVLFPHARRDDLLLRVPSCGPTRCSRNPSGRRNEIEMALACDCADKDLEQAPRHFPMNNREHDGRSIKTCPTDAHPQQPSAQRSRGVKAAATARPLSYTLPGAEKTGALDKRSAYL